ncbi:MAG: phosphoglucosamine mutase [Acidobacteriota bacterium]|nr:phosphoglucosamine mutase [Acidobacteriota bacterium]
MAVRFGTDGIRGRVDEEVTLELSYQLGWAVARVLRATTYVGYDTRESSPALAAAVLAGLRDGGATGVHLGFFTTPGVAYVAQSRGGAGVVVSASHNPYFDNGLKVLGVGGAKLERARELELEAALSSAPRPPSLDFTLAAIDADAETSYVARLRELVSADFSSLRLVVDCAHGAASHVAPELFSLTGADVTILHASPDGLNINFEAGSTDVARLVACVRETGADLGLALDGDADRLIAVDHTGQVRNGDDLMVLFASDRLAQGTLGGGVALTTMSNLGVRRALEDLGVDVVETDVGDRNVLVALEERDWLLGGEQSGHVIFRDLASTGDGLLTGLVLCDLVCRRGALADQANAAWTRVPQEMVNVAVADFDDDVVRAIFDEVRAPFAFRDADVRLVVRPSGTEPVVRVMVESLSQDFVTNFIDALGARFTLL